MNVAVQQNGLDLQTERFYRRTLDVLNRSGVPYLVGGAYALAHYTGVVRHTKDLDVFVRPSDCERVLQLLAEGGYATELTFPHWLGKAYHGDDFVDVIFSSGNGLAEVDDDWFRHAAGGKAFGRAVAFCPAEEMIWSKGFLLERERFDGADIAHLLRARAGVLDWPRLLGRFGPHWRVLLSHLVLFGYTYPGERDKVPAGVLDELLGRLRGEADGTPPRERVCRGTFLSREQYLPDVQRWGYQDARLLPHGPMSEAEVAHWTAAIGAIR
jgi:hypothetical protein